MTKIYVQPEEPGLTLDKALSLLEGSLQWEELTPDQKEKVEGRVPDENYEIILEKERHYRMEREGYEITQPTAFLGNGAVLEGSGRDGFLVTCGNVLFRDLCFRKFRENIVIDGRNRIIAHILIKNVTFVELQGAPIHTGTTESGGGIRDLTVESCHFVNHDEQEAGNVTDGYSSISLNAASSRKENAVEDALLEDVLIQNCTFSGNSRETINIMGAVCGGMLRKEIPQSPRSYIHNVRILNNRFEGSYDATINLITGFLNNDDAVCDGFEVAGNHIVFGLWGIFMAAGEPMLQSVKGARLRNVKVHDNVLIRKAGGCGEPSAGIAVNGGRLDFYTARCTDCGAESVDIFRNRIEGTDRGIVVDGGHSLLDGDPPSEVSDCFVRNIQIRGNTMRDVVHCFQFYGANLEGRRYDWKIGVPPADIEWQKPVADHGETTLFACGNRVEQLSCTDNRAEGFSCMLEAAGVCARGHALVRDNRLDQKILLAGNEWKKGEMHFLVSDTLLQDWAKEEGGNQAILDLRW